MIEQKFLQTRTGIRTARGGQAGERREHGGRGEIATAPPRVGSSPPPIAFKVRPLGRS